MVNTTTSAKATNKVSTQREFTPEDIDNFERLEREREGMIHSSFLQFDINAKTRIEFNPALTKIKPNMVFGKVKKNADGSYVRGPNGELYKESDGSVLMGLDGKPARPATKYLYYCWHYGNKEEQHDPLEWAVGKENDRLISDFMKDLHTNVFNITKEKQGPKVSYKIMPVLNVDPNEQYRTNTEQYGEPTQEEQEAASAQRDYEASRHT